MSIRESSYGYWSSPHSFGWVAAGAAMGIGNLLRLPYLMGEHGGVLFLLVYLAALMFVGMPLLVAEWMLGRWMRDDLVAGFRKLVEVAGLRRIDRIHRHHRHTPLEQQLMTPAHRIRQLEEVKVRTRIKLAGHRRGSGLCRKVDMRATAEQMHGGGAGFQRSGCGVEGRRAGPDHRHRPCRERGKINRLRSV